MYLQSITIATIEGSPASNISTAELDISTIYRDYPETASAWGDFSKLCLDGHRSLCSSGPISSPLPIIHINVVESLQTQPSSSAVSRVQSFQAPVNEASNAPQFTTLQPRSPVIVASSSTARTRLRSSSNGQLRATALDNAQSHISNGLDTSHSPIPNGIIQPISSQYQSPLLPDNLSSTSNASSVLLRASVPPSAPIQVIPSPVIRTIGCRITRRMAHELAFGVENQPNSALPRHIGSDFVRPPEEDDSVDGQQRSEDDSADFRVQSTSSSNGNGRRGKNGRRTKAPGPKCKPRGSSISSLPEVRLSHSSVWVQYIKYSISFKSSSSTVQLFGKR